MTLTASYYKVFSDDPKLSFFAQRNATLDAIDAGKVVPPAKTMDDMHTIVTNTTVDGILAAFFALMVIIVLVDASRVWIKAIRSQGPLPTTETPSEPSVLWAPSGLIPTSAERARARSEREPVVGVGGGP